MDAALRMLALRNGCLMLKTCCSGVDGGETCLGFLGYPSQKVCALREVRLGKPQGSLRQQTCCTELRLSVRSSVVIPKV